MEDFFYLILFIIENLGTKIYESSAPVNIHVTRSLYETNLI